MWCTHYYYDIKPHFMSETLFLRIISGLQEMDFSGRLSLFQNGEPLLDTRLSRWIALAKKSCPKSFTFIITNGDLLTHDRALELLDAGLDAIKVNTYDDTTFAKVSETIRELHPSLSSRIKHYDYSRKTDWTSRGGTVPVAKKNARTEMNEPVCPRPFMQMYITWNGLVAQCCSDYLCRHVMGDLNTQSLEEVWNGERFAEVRNSLLGNRELNELCKVCDLERTYETADELRKLFERKTALIR